MDMHKRVLAYSLTGVLALGGAGAAWACGDRDESEGASDDPAQTQTTTTDTTTSTAASRRAAARRAAARRAAARRAAARRG